MACRSLKRRLLGGVTALAGLCLAAPVSAAGLQAAQPPPVGDAAAQSPAAPSVAATPPSTAAAGPGAEAPTVGELVIVATRYEASTLQMRSNNTVNVLSASDLNHTAVHNVAEALGLLPGVTVTTTSNGFIGGVDAASRGEGMYAAVRGLDTEFNVNMLNGVSVAVGNPYSRAVQLSLLPPSGLQTVVLNKTSRADMDGDAIGGTIDFRTPTAFDFPGGPHFSAVASGRLETRALELGADAGGGGFAADGSTKFGRNGQFGVYVSGYYDRRSYANNELGGVMESGCCDSAWNFAVQNPGSGDNSLSLASNPSNLDPAKNLILTGFNVGVSSGYTERYGGTAAFDWRPDDTLSAYVRANYAYALTRQDSQLSQLVGMNVKNGSNGQQIGTTGLYQPIISNLSTRYWYETNPEESVLAAGQVGFDKRVGGWTILPQLFASFGLNDRPDHIEIAARTLLNGGNGYAYGGTSLVTYADDFPVAQIPANIAAALNQPATYPIATYVAPELTQQLSRQGRGGAKLDLRRDFDGGGLLKYVQVGGKYVYSQRNVNNRDYSITTTQQGVFGDLGLITGYFDPGYPGKYTQRIAQIDQEKLFQQYQAKASNDYLDSCGGGFFNAYNCNTQYATEGVASVYAEAGLQYGDVEVIPGLRFEHTDIHNRFFLQAQDADGNTIDGSFKKNDASFDEPLPSLFVNWRPNGQSVYRAGVWRSYTRPAFVQLGGGASTSVSQGVTTITQGNPNLSPITSWNLDASGEWDNRSGGHLMVGAFYKRLDDYIYDSGGSPANVAVQSGVTTGTVIRTPQNGGSGNVYGLELAARLRFQQLPGLLSGFGVSANFTAQHTDVELTPGAETVRIQNAPDVLANGQLFYEKGGFSADILINYTGAYIINYDYLGLGSHFDDLWNRPIRRMDMHAGYNFHNGLQVDASVSNVLGDEGYWSHLGEHSLAISDIVQTGRTVLMTVKYSY